MIHLAVANYSTACRKTTSRSAHQMKILGDEAEFDHALEYSNQHTSDPDFVTCEDCKNTDTYKEAVKNASEDYVH